MSGPKVSQARFSVPNHTVRPRQQKYLDRRNVCGLKSGLYSYGDLARVVPSAMLGATSFNATLSALTLS